MSERLRACGRRGGWSRGSSSPGSSCFALLYVLVIAKPPDESGRQLADDELRLGDRRLASFSRTLLNGLTFAGLLFIVASGFSLIFGLMRVVNMAHGSFYLLGGYIAYEIQQRMTGQGFSHRRREVNTGSGCSRALVAMRRASASSA